VRFAAGVIPAPWVPVVVSLGLGAVGVLVGLFIGFAPSPEAAAFRRARRGTTTGLREGEHVVLIGELVTASPLRGVVSDAQVAVMRLERRERSPRDPDDRDQDTTAHELRVAPGLALRDHLGQVYVVPEAAGLLTKSVWRGSERTVDAVKWRENTTPETLDLTEHSIEVGAPVVAIGQATWDRKAWTLGGTDLVLTNHSLDALEARFRAGRVGGVVLIVLSALLGLAAAGWHFPR
jgi:hypothetical protein